MNLMWAASGAIIGLPAGTLLRDPVFRLSVPHGAADRTTCDHCGAPVRFWFVGRCRHCRKSVGPGPVLELSTAAVLALLMSRFGGQPDMVAFAFLGVLGVTLAAIDISVQRLPDRLVLPAFPVVICLLATVAVMSHDVGAIVRALLGGLVLGVSYLTLALLRPGGLGGGDVKLAGVAGLALGWLGWPSLLMGAVLGFMLAALAMLCMLAARRISLHSTISFGPFLLGGALLAILTSGGGPV